MEATSYDCNIFKNIDLLKKTITPRQLVEDPFSRKTTDKSVVKSIMAVPLSTQSEKLYLYFEGEETKSRSLGSDSDYPLYFLEKGYEVIENPSPSLLIDAVAQLNETIEVIWGLGMRSDTNIILISTPPLFTDFRLESFLNARLKPDSYIGLISADYINFRDSAFLVRKL